MWIFTRYGFFSAVCARDGNGDPGKPIDSDRIMVRARVRSHLERLLKRFGEPFPMSADDIQAFSGSDYPFRIFVEKTTWIQVMELLVAEMDYDNFKSDVHRHRAWVGENYEMALHDVWATMRKLEEAERQQPSHVDLHAVPVQQRTALKSDWKTRALPKRRAVLHPQRFYTATEMQRIRRGLTPRQMEHKWFIYWEAQALFLHRSWTGFCTYVVHFERCKDGHRIDFAEVNRNPKQYSEVDDDRDTKMVCWLIDLLLLGQDSAFPQSGSDSEAAALEQWHQVGSAMFAPGGMPTTEGGDEADKA